MIILKCAKCGKMVFVEKKSGCPTMCCGDAMEELIPGSVDAAQEKHVPVLAARGNRVQVTVGSVEHPEAPKAEFLLAEGESALAAYEYCNLHGLWKAELKQPE